MNEISAEVQRRRRELAEKFRQRWPDGDIEVWETTVEGYPGLYITWTDGPVPAAVLEAAGGQLTATITVEVAGLKCQRQLELIELNRLCSPRLLLAALIAYRERYGVCFDPDDTRQEEVPGSRWHAWDRLPAATDSIDLDDWADHDAFVVAATLAGDAGLLKSAGDPTHPRDAVHTTQALAAFLRDGAYDAATAVTGDTGEPEGGPGR